MDRKEQGRILREWRKHMSARRGQKITLMSLAGEVADLAEQQGHDRNSRKIPGSHASMTRWELGNVDQSLAGLQIIATIYGVKVADLFRSPPDLPPGPAPENGAGEADDELVREFREFLKARKR